MQGCGASILCTGIPRERSLLPHLQASQWRRRGGEWRARADGDWRSVISRRPQTRFLGLSTHHPDVRHTSSCTLPCGQHTLAGQHVHSTACWPLSGRPRKPKGASHLHSSWTRGRGQRRDQVQREVPCHALTILLGWIASHEETIGPACSRFHE
jgi:hypothetical protein